MNEKRNSEFVGTGKTKNRTETQPKNEPIITGILTSRIETRPDYYHYGFFKIPDQELDVPVIFKTKPDLVKGSQVKLTGT